MYKTFGQIPPPNPGAASAIADAARHAENNLNPDPESGPLSDRSRIQWPSVDLPIGDDSQEVVEEVGPVVSPAIRDIGDESHEGTTGGVIDEGMEYLAFYKSFRDATKPPARNRWGIFFIRKRCIGLATDIAFTTGQAFAECLDSLAAFLYTHELYHYRIDAHCLQMEATGGIPIYRPYRKLVASKPIAEWHEESVANYYGLKALHPSPHSLYPKSICDYLFDLVANSPGAYAGGVESHQRRRRDQMVQQALSAVGVAGPPGWHALLESTLRVGTGLSKIREPALGSLLHLSNCPVYWIDWVRGGKSVLTPYVASVTEVNNDFIKRYLAGVQDHQSDHSFYRIDNGEMVKLPNPHRADLTNREFHNIIGKAGMTSQQFYKERARTSVWRKHVPRSPVLPPRFTQGK